MTADFCSSTGKRPIRTHDSKWEVVIKIDIKEIWYECVWWNYLAQDRTQWLELLITVMNI
jgi:hypothetical protein